jgi:flagellin
MSSILTNMSAMSAVTNLAATQSSLASVENEISTGLKVGTAKDNAAYWSIATSMRTTTGELSAVSDSLNLGSSVVGTAAAALAETVSLLQKMSDDLVTAQTSGMDKSKIQTDIAALQNQLKTTVGSASFNGVNLLDQSNASVTNQQIVSSVTGSGTSFSVNTITIDYSNTALTTSGSNPPVGILDSSGSQSGQAVLSFDVTNMTQGQLAAIAKDVSLASLKVQTAASQIGGYQTNIDLQTTFVKSLSDSITEGIGSLVDADMNQASTRLNALQTQQQLGIQSLSVANQNSQMILKLFGA